MSFLGKLGRGLARFGSLAGAALKPISNIVSPIAGAVSAAANTFLPPSVAGVVSGVANKVADFVQSGKAADIAGKIGQAGMALAGGAMGGMPRADG